MRTNVEKTPNEFQPDHISASGNAPVLRWLQPERVFAAITLSFGLAVLLLNPPFQAPDEPDHFYRAFQLSQGDVLGQRRGTSAGGELPTAAIVVADTAGIPFHPEVKMSEAIFRKKLDPLFVHWNAAPRGYAHFPHSVYYPPTSYTPQALSIALGKLFHLGPLLLLYAARVSSLVCYLILGWTALGRLRSFRWSCAVLMLAPMSLYIMGSVAPDGLLIGSAFLLAAMAVNYGADRLSPLTTRELSLLIALSSLVTIVKIVYFPLALAAAALAFGRLSTPRQRVTFAIAFLVFCMAPAYVWARLASGVYVAGRSDIPIDPVAQSHSILTHPLSFIGIVGRTIRYYGPNMYEWTVGVLGWGDTVLPSWYYRFFAVSFLTCVLVDAATATPLRWRHRTLFVGAAVATFLLICAAQYVTWNSPGASGAIDGICGRYFLPFMPFLVLTVPAVRWLKISPSLAPIVGTTSILTGAIVCVFALTSRYYFH
jgi:uncharacterized membrane protein